MSTTTKPRKRPGLSLHINLQKAIENRDRILANDPDFGLPPCLRVNRSEVSEIFPWLFISGETTASDPEILEVRRTPLTRRRWRSPT